MDRMPEHSAEAKLRLMAEGMSVVLTPRSWGWMAQDLYDSCASVEVLDFETALVVGAWHDPDGWADSPSLMRRLGEALHGAAIPTLQIYPVEWSRVTSGNTASQELNLWLQQRPRWHLAQLILDLPIPVHQATEGENTILGLLTNAWESSLGERGVANAKDYEAVRRLRERMPSRKLSPEALAALL